MDFNNKPSNIIISNEICFLVEFNRPKCDIDLHTSKAEKEAFKINYSRPSQCKS